MPLSPKLAPDIVVQDSGSKRGATARPESTFGPPGRPFSDCRLHEVRPPFPLPLSCFRGWVSMNAIHTTPTMDILRTRCDRPSSAHERTVARRSNILGDHDDPRPSAANIAASAVPRCKRNGARDSLPPPSQPKALTATSGSSHVGLLHPPSPPFLPTDSPSGVPTPALQPLPLAPTEQVAG